jgi:ribonucleoside-diphosphate reductase alpha chain
LGQVKESLLKIREIFQIIETIPQHFKDIYKTSFTTSPYAFIEVAARAQKWVDQALSRNMYLETSDIDETMRIYQTAWDKGLEVHILSPYEAAAHRRAEYGFSQ